MNDSLVQSAVIRQFEIIGEAANTDNGETQTMAKIYYFSVVKQHYAERG